MHQVEESHGAAAVVVVWWMVIVVVVVAKTSADLVVRTIESRVMTINTTYYGGP